MTLNLNYTSVRDASDMRFEQPAAGASWICETFYLRSLASIFMILYRIWSRGRVLATKDQLCHFISFNANTWNQKLDSEWLVTDAHTCNMSKGELLIPSIKEVITI